MSLVTAIYKALKSYPKQEQFGIVSQMQRAAVSIPSNIAEGQSRQTSKEFIQFLYVAKGSLAELETQVIISAELDYLSNDEEKSFCADCDEVSRMIQGLIETLKKRNN